MATSMGGGSFGLHVDNQVAVNTAAVVTLPARPGQAWHVLEVLWSYDGTPAGGSLSIVSGTQVVEFSITNAGPGNYPPSGNVVAFAGPIGAEVVITLAAGGAVVSGKLNVKAK